METIAPHVMALTTGQLDPSTYGQDLVTALAAVAALAATLAVVFLVLKATYLLLRFTGVALQLTAVLVVLFVLIGWFNR